jgi:hypothetical protein
VNQSRFSDLARKSPQGDSFKTGIAFLAIPPKPAAAAISDPVSIPSQHKEGHDAVQDVRVIATPEMRKPWAGYLQLAHQPRRETIARDTGSHKPSTKGWLNSYRPAEAYSGAQHRCAGDITVDGRPWKVQIREKKPSEPA